MKWLERMKSWFFKPADPQKLSIQNDRFGYALQGKPKFLLRPWIEKLIAKTVMPEDQQRLLDEFSQRGTVVYAIKYRSQLDLVYLTLRLYQLGLPAPGFVYDLHPYAWQPRWYAIKIMVFHFYQMLRRWRLPNPDTSGYYKEKILSNVPGLLFLLGEKGYYQRTVLAGDDPLQQLFQIQKEHDRPIFVVPAVLLYTRDPGKERRGLWETFLGHREYPGPIRKLLSFFRGYATAVLEIGEPLDLQKDPSGTLRGPQRASQTAVSTAAGDDRRGGYHQTGRCRAHHQEQTGTQRNHPQPPAAGHLYAAEGALRQSGAVEGTP